MLRSRTSVWSPPAPQQRPVNYVVVIGTSGSGKSTLVTQLSEELFAQTDVVGIDERDTHHPYLDRLFFDPGRYAYQLQLNFMIQRTLIAQRWLDAGVNVVMERSHLDDCIFIDHLSDQGYVSPVERDTYRRLWGELGARAPEPDAIVCLDVSPATSIARVTKAEMQNKRPREFPDENTKSKWLTSWCELYRQRFIAICDEPRYAAKSRIFDDNVNPNEVVQWVRQTLNT